ncbi:hypothetical protein Q5P01_002226 [Channa striata]|uniref:Interleukin-13 receptor subunit alpha-1 n=1 Tax=Channa striata TaxID=64152 RepID=A0AA88NSX5_CHASR|nr:hypothetical protein Q5P01_002226 [Channa striata]
MSRTFRSLNLFAFSCLFLTVQSHTGKVSPPKNVTLRWKSDFDPELSWAPPEHSVENCTYEVNLQTNHKNKFENYTNLKAPHWTNHYVMDGGFLNFSVRTVCNGHRSEAEVLSVRYPELVKNLECYFTSSTKAHCSWEAAAHTQDVRFYYWSTKDLSTNKSVSGHLKECLFYNNTKDLGTVCDLQPEDEYRLKIVVKGTVDNQLARNTFQKDLYHDVRPPPLQWNVTKSGDKFYITWNAPDIPSFLDIWEFWINYTECGTAKQEKVQGTSFELNVVHHCAYRITVVPVCKPGYCKQKKMPWSEEKYFGADTDPNALVYTAIIVPLMFAGLAALAFVCCRKNKEKVFPKVPQPRDLLSEISDNNNKITVRNLYIPAKEEENCKISLVTDPQISKPNL